MLWRRRQRYRVDRVTVAAGSWPATRNSVCCRKTTVIASSSRESECWGRSADQRQPHGSSIWRRSSDRSRSAWRVLSSSLDYFVSLDGPPPSWWRSRGENRTRYLGQKGELFPRRKIAFAFRCNLQQEPSSPRHMHSHRHNSAEDGYAKAFLPNRKPETSQNAA